MNKISGSFNLEVFRFFFEMFEDQRRFVMPTSAESGVTLCAIFFAKTISSVEQNECKNYLRKVGFVSVHEMKCLSKN